MSVCTAIATDHLIHSFSCSEDIMSAAYFFGSWTVHRALLVSCVPILIGCLSAPAQGADAPTVLEPMVITATRNTTTLSDVPQSVSVVDRDRIVDTPAKSLDDVLRTTPSVNLPIAASYQLHPTAGYVSMRGLGGARALVLLDGVPLNDPFFGYIQWNHVPLEEVDRVEVVRGGGAALWGNYAMGGVINIITRAPEHDRYVAESGGGSYGTYRANGYAARTLADGASVSVDVGGNGTDGFNAIRPADRSRIDAPTAFSARNIQIAGQFVPDPTLDGHVRLGYHGNDQTLYSRLSINSQDVWNISGDLTKNFGDMSLTGTVFHIDSRFRTDNTDTPTGFARGDAEFVQNRHITPATNTGASLLWSLNNRGALRLLSFGSDFQQIDGTDSASIFNDTGSLVRTDIGRGSQRFIGLFAQAAVVPTTGLDVLMSARYQRFENFDGLDSAPGGLGAVPDTARNSFDPRISVRYSVLPEFALRAAGYKAFRAPTLDNLYRTFSTPFGIFHPNATLKPERLTGWESGFDVVIAKMRAQVTYYDNTIDNLLTFRNLGFAELPPGFFFGSVNINAGSAESRGVEAELDWTLSPGLDANFGYAFAHSPVVDNPLDLGSVGRQQANVPLHAATAGVTYTDFSGWHAATRVRWVGKTYSDNDHTLKIDPHVVVDLSLSYPLSDGVEPFVNIENLFDRSYIADNSGFSAPQLGTPLTAFAGLRVRFE